MAAPSIQLQVLQLLLLSALIRGTPTQPALKSELTFSREQQRHLKNRFLRNGLPDSVQSTRRTSALVPSSIDVQLQMRKHYQEESQVRPLLANFSLRYESLTPQQTDQLLSANLRVCRLFKVFKRYALASGGCVLQRLSSVGNAQLNDGPEEDFSWSGQNCNTVFATGGRLATALRSGENLTILLSLRGGCTPLPSKKATLTSFPGNSASFTWKQLESRLQRLTDTGLIAVELSQDTTVGRRLALGIAGLEMQQVTASGLTRTRRTVNSTACSLMKIRVNARHLTELVGRTVFFPPHIYIGHCAGSCAAQSHTSSLHRLLMARQSRFSSSTNGSPATRNEQFLSNCSPTRFSTFSLQYSDAVWGIVRSQYPGVMAAECGCS